MSRRSVIWLLTLPLAVVGSQLAHAFAYRLGAGSDTELAHELAATGHGYLAYAPIALAICAVLVLFALVRELLGVAAIRPTRRSASLSPFSFALVAPAIFVTQEHLERFVHTGSLTVLANEQTFVLGLALQLPFALAGYLFARLLLHAAHAVARLLPHPCVAPVRARSRWRVHVVRTPPARPTGLALGPRGPPVLLVV